jgi:hypothetical protein
MWINGHAWIVLMKSQSMCFILHRLLRSPKRSLLVNGLLPRATAPFFSVKLFELAA